MELAAVRVTDLIAVSATDCPRLFFLLLPQIVSQKPLPYCVSLDDCFKALSASFPAEVRNH